ncbi:MAG: hypothetical protein GF398_19825 [Chitinivibrionales bacterium]|nr:hypothetical protein [Chitinivibrionales bacterium]
MNSNIRITFLPGAAIQLISAALLVTLAAMWRESVLTAAMLTIGAGVGVWLHAFLAHVRANVPKDSRLNGKVSRLILVSVQGLIEPFLISALWYHPIRLVVLRNTSFQATTTNVSFQLSLFALFAFGTFVMSEYLLKQTISRQHSISRAGALYARFCSFVFGLLLANSALQLAHGVSIDKYVYFIILAVNFSIAAEIVLMRIARYFTGSRKRSDSRSIVNFYFVESLVYPHKLRILLKEMLNGLIGYDVVHTSPVALLKNVALPAATASFLFMLAMTCFSFVQPNEQAILIRNGRNHGKSLEPGMHLKLPWPFDEMKAYNVTEIQRLHIGSHQPIDTSDDVYIKGVPILWTNEHGVNMDELLIISAPEMLMRQARESGGKFDASKEQAPSISLAGADIIVEYVIKDLIAYVGSSRQPEVLFKKLAEAEASRILHRYDIDQLLCDARFEISAELFEKIAAAAHKADLGVGVLYVGIAAVHPPIDVAASFEESITARQERHTTIQQARQRAARLQIETVGSQDNFDSLVALINSVESPDAFENDNIEAFLRKCGGEISRSMTSAYAYRWVRENVEQAKAERFLKEAILHQTSPQRYKYERYFAIFEKGLAEARKMVLTGDKSDVLIRMNMPRLDMKKLPDITGEF